jgi:protoporphyrinogen oxidase
LKIAIIGGGLTGLSAALRLKEANLPGVSEIVILEEQDYPGGLFQSTNQNGYWWDNGVFCFLQSNYLCQLFPDLFRPPEDIAQKAWLKGGICDFPIAKSLLLKESKFALLGCAFDYLYSYIRCTLGWDGDNLHDWLRYRLMSYLLKLSQLETYVTKLQGLPPTKLSPRLGELRLRNVHEITRPGRMLSAIFASPRKIKEMKIKSDPVVYPYGGGVGKISWKLAELCQTKGIRMVYGAQVKELIREDTGGVTIHYDSSAGPAVYHSDFAISTIPLEELVSAYKPPLSEESRAYARQLEYMDLKLIFLVVKRPLIFHKFFILYSLEDHHPWKRLVSLAHPSGLNTVTIEIAFNPKVNRLDDDVEDQVIKQLTEELKLFEAEEIILRHSKIVRRAYPIYSLGFEEKVDAIIKEVESERVQLAGRQGRFLYVTTPGAVQSAIEAADRIVQSITVRSSASDM